jgi:hypothetical protein
VVVLTFADFFAGFIAGPSPLLSRALLLFTGSFADFSSSSRLRGAVPETGL